jgi:hypothetical protein
MSIRVERTAFLRGFDKIRNAYIPLVWIEESGGVDDFLATVLKVILVYIIDGSVAFAWFLMIIGWGTSIVTFFYGVFWTGRRLDSEERLYSVTDSKDQSKAQLANAAADSDDETDADGDIDDDSGDSNVSENSALNKKIDLNLRASAPSLEKRSPSSPSQTLKHTYVPVYRKTTTTIVQSHHQQQQHHHQQAIRSASYKNIRNTTSESPIVVYRPTSTSTTTSPTTPTKARPLSSASAKSLPRIRDLDEIRTSVSPPQSPILVPLVDKNAL